MHPFVVPCDLIPHRDDACGPRRCVFPDDEQMFGFTEEHLATFLVLLTARNQTGINHSTSARDPLPGPDGTFLVLLGQRAKTGQGQGALTGNTSWLYRERLDTINVCTRSDGLNSLVLLGQTVFMN